MTACKGDTIALRLFAVNGDEHHDWVEGTEWRRGREGDETLPGPRVLVRFKAKQSGVYTLICNKH